MMATLHRRLRLAGWVLAMLMIGAPRVAEAQRAEPEAHGNMERGVHPLVVVAGAAGGSTRVTVLLPRTEGGTQVASYQGELRYDGGEITPTRVEFPSGVAGSWNLTSPGRIRFAGASVDGIGEGPMVTLHVRAPRAVQASDFNSTLEELSLHGQPGRVNPPVTAVKKTP
jgi:hypothetical protein